MSDTPSSDRSPSGKREVRSLARLRNRGSQPPSSPGLARSGQGQSRAKRKPKRNRSGCPEPRKIIEFVLHMLDANDALEVRNHLGLPDEAAGDSPGGDCPRRGCPDCQVECDALRLAFKESLRNLFVSPK